jgi:hypothetical protein
VPGGPPVAIFSDALWQRRFGDPTMGPRPAKLQWLARVADIVGTLARQRLLLVFSVDDRDVAIGRKRYEEE